MTSNTNSNEKSLRTHRWQRAGRELLRWQMPKLSEECNKTLSPTQHWRNRSITDTEMDNSNNTAVVYNWACVVCLSDVEAATVSWLQRLTDWWQTNYVRCWCSSRRQRSRTGTATAAFQQLLLIQASSAGRCLCDSHGPPPGRPPAIRSAIASLCELRKRRRSYATPWEVYSKERQTKIADFPLVHPVHLRKRYLYESVKKILQVGHMKISRRNAITML